MGDLCESRGLDYTWCHSGAHIMEEWEDWGRDGMTSEREACESPCQQEGKDYWWCYTDGKESDWGYCSPPGEVVPVVFTIKGQECTSGCAQHGKSYWWCNKSLRKRVTTGVQCGPTTSLTTLTGGT